ncbi:hypothetical protein GQ457_15G024420 [Hibiscus cannabinus]
MERHPFHSVKRQSIPGRKSFRHLKEIYQSRDKVRSVGLNSSRVKRVGVIVFVNFLSKNIHPESLKEAFLVYGDVLDVYIAYNNIKKAGMKSTFAFARFSKMEEALLAVHQANNRWMDGFKIKVFLGKEHASVSAAHLADRRSRLRFDHRTTLAGKGVDGRSYKDALLCNIGKTCLDEFKEVSNVALDTGSSRKPAASVSVDPISIVIKDKDKEWLQNCLIVQISAMYDSEWGDFIRLDTETSERSRLDVAKILVGVKCLSSILPFLCFESNGIKFNLRTSISKYDDESCWIDEEKCNERLVCHLDSRSSSLERSCSGNVFSGDSKILKRNNEPLLLLNDSIKDRDVFPRDGVKVADLSWDNSFPRPLEDPVFPSVGPASVSRPGKEFFTPNLCEKSLENNHIEKGDLFEVQVAEASESAASVGHSVSIELVLDPGFGLFSIKPKLVTCLGRFNFTPNRKKSFAGRSWGPFCSQRGPKVSSSSGMKVGSDSREVGHRLGSMKGRIEAGASGVNLELNLDEARASVQVCKKLRLQFEGDKEAILRNFMS